jgi:DnaJ-class molecular chaperone
LGKRERSGFFNSRVNTENSFIPEIQEDHEIFDLVTDLEAAEGRGTTFYSWLEVPSTASTTEIAKAYRKKSMQLQ